MLVRKRYIRQTVEGLIADHDIRYGTAVNVLRIAKALGITIVEEPAEDNLSGFLLRDSENKKIVIGVNSNHPLTRQRFTVAHELGHFLLHKYEGFHFDGTDYGMQLRFRDERATEGTDVDEREANLFAAELLMPKSFMDREVEALGRVDLLGNLKELERLAKRYKVSSQAITYRLTNLGYIQ